MDDSSCSYTGTGIMFYTCRLQVQYWELLNTIDDAGIGILYPKPDISSDVFPSWKQYFLYKTFDYSHGPLPKTVVT